MDYHRQTNQLLAILAEVMGLPGNSALRLDDANESILAVEENLVVMFYLEDNTGSLIINVPLGPLPKGPEREEVLLALLQANYCWNLTEGGTFGVDEDTGIISLSYLVSLPLDPPSQIVTIVEKLADVVIHWRKELPGLSEGLADPEPAAAASGSMLRV